MSLLKALKLHTSKGDFTQLEKDFLNIIETSDTYTTDDLVALVQIYSMYSVHYLTYVAQTLQEPTGTHQTMKFMNSYIAEVCHATNNKYFNNIQSYSLIDKAVAEALNNEGKVSEDFVQGLITEINESYKEAEDDTAC